MQRKKIVRLAIYINIERNGARLDFFLGGGEGGGGRVGVEGIRY